MGKAMNAQRYDTLDALRGIAALIVVGFHLSQFGMIPAIVPRGYLAVDFFFVLSGFVVAHAYEKDLRTHLSLRSFIIKRIIRLYPLAFLGAGMGLTVLLLKWMFFPEKVETLGILLASGMLNLAMVPSFLGATVASHDLFPGNGPLWSLFFELLINLAWAACGIWLRTSTLILIILMSLIFLALFASHYQAFNIGYDTATFWGGLARVCFGFPLGVVIYREQHRIGAYGRHWSVFTLSVVLAGVFAIPVDLSAQSFPWVDLFLITICLPAIVIGGIGQTSAIRSSYVLGGLSYPVYILHFPVILMMSGLSQSLLSGWNVHVIASISFILILTFSWIAWRFYDEPLRRVLTSMVRKGDGKLHPSPEPVSGASQSDGRKVNVGV
ncbi:acyltransferase family protein [Phyllobacterium sp. K27]